MTNIEMTAMSPDICPYTHEYFNLGLVYAMSATDQYLLWFLIYSVGRQSCSLFENKTTDLSLNPLQWKFLNSPYGVSKMVWWL